MAETRKSVKVITGSADWLPTTIALFKDAFAADPILIYLINSISNDEKRQMNLGRLLQTLVNAGAINDGIFYYGQQGDIQEADGKTAQGGCRGMLMTRPKTLDSISTTARSLNKTSLKMVAAVGPFSLLRKMFGAYQDQTHAAKKEVLKPGEKYYYMYWLATDANDRRKGMSLAMIPSSRKTLS